MSRLVASLALGLLLVSCSSSPDEAAAGGAGSAAGGAAQGGAAGAGGAAQGGAAQGGAAQGGAASGLPCEVDALLTARCQQCHSNPPKFGAPMPLVTRADLFAKAPSDPSTTVAAQSVVRMKDDVNPMPQPPNPRATAAEQAAFEAWVQAGLPMASGTCAGAGGSGGAAQGGAAGAAQGGAGGAAQGACTPDQVVRATTPWTIKQSAVDEYVCFGGKIAATGQKRQITQVYVDIDNQAHAHHLCIYDVGSNPVPTEPKTCSAGSAISKGKLLYCWAPGADAETLPPEAGFPIAADKDTNILIEMHYSNIQGAPDSIDNSGATFCTTDQLRPNDADVMAFGSGSFSLPAHQNTTVESVFTIPNKLLPGGSIKVIRGWPHMHLLGVAQNTLVTRNGAQMADLGSTTTYSFQNQIGYPLDATLQTGDKITTRCVYNNTTDSTVSYGENTQAEMCYNFVTYYPRITNPQWVWAAPGYLGNNTTYPTP